MKAYSNQRLRQENDFPGGGAPQNNQPGGGCGGDLIRNVTYDTSTKAIAVS
jgi:hypothetical protein